MISRICHLSVLLSLHASLAANANTFDVYLDIEQQSVLPREPVIVTVNIRNSSSSMVEIAPLFASGGDASIEFYVINDKGTNQVLMPIYIVEQVEGGQPNQLLSLSAGQTVSKQFVMGMEWATGSPIFIVGTNWLFCIVNVGDREQLESQPVSLVARMPKTAEEIDMSTIFTDQEALRSLYCSDYLLLTKHPSVVVASIRRIARFDVPLAAYAREALATWKVYEQNARNGKAPDLKARGFDKLGLSEEAQ